MAGLPNARLLSPWDTEALRRELAALSVSAEEFAAVVNSLPARVTIIDGIDAAEAVGVAQAMRHLSGAAVWGTAGDSTTLLLLGNAAQYQRLVRALDQRAALTAQSALEAWHHYSEPRRETKIGDKTFTWGLRTFVMGIVNVTPDSFSGDGLGLDLGAALAQAERFVAEGADIIDVGGESTRPGSARLDVTEELRRVLPVVARFSHTLPVPVSIDTYHADVAERCLDAGAALVNDIWGLRADHRMAGLVARREVPVILMHNQQGIAYRNLMGDIIRLLRENIALARAAGVREENIIVDPGIGFGKSKEQNLEVLHRLEELKVLGRPLLLGTSRKSTIGYVLNLPPEERIEGTAATVALGIAQGADLVRVHDVRTMVRVCRMTDAIVRWRSSGVESHQWPGQTG